MENRTDTVIDSSSSSYVALTVRTKKQKTLKTTCHMSNFFLYFLHSIHLSGEKYESLKTGQELLEICYDYVEETTKGLNIDYSFDGNEEEIRDIKSIKKEVSSIEIETFMDDNGDIYNKLDSYDFSTRSYVHKNIYEDYNPNFDIDYPDREESTIGVKKSKPKRRRKIRYYSGTFEDNFFSPEVEKLVIEKFCELSSEEKRHVIKNLNSEYYKGCNGITVEENDDGSQVYESICRFHAGNECATEELRDINLYIDGIDWLVADYHKTQDYPKMISEPKTIVCNGLYFTTTDLFSSQDIEVENDVTSRGGFYRDKASGKTNVLIVYSNKTITKNFDKAVENIKKGKNTIVITYPHYLKLKKTGNLI